MCGFSGFQTVLLPLGVIWFQYSILECEQCVIDHAINSRNFELWVKITFTLKYLIEV